MVAMSPTFSDAVARGANLVRQQSRHFAGSQIKNFTTERIVICLKENGRIQPLPEITDIGHRGFDRTHLSNCVMPE
jgi:hypothetical protein